MSIRESDESIKREIKAKLKTGIYKLQTKKWKHGVLWEKYAVIAKTEDGSILERYYCCIHCKTIFKCATKQVTSLYRHIRLCTKKSNDDNDEIDIEADNEQDEKSNDEFEDGTENRRSGNKVEDTNENSVSTRFEDEQGPKTINIDEESGGGSHEFVNIDAERGDSSQEFLDVDAEPGGGSHEFVNIDAGRGDSSQEFLDVDAEPGGGSHEFVNIDAERGDSSQEFLDVDAEPGGGSHEFVDVVETGPHIDVETVQNDTLKLKDNDLFEVQKCSMQNPIWQTFNLILSDEGKEELSCRLCKMALECDYSSKSRLETHKCRRAEKRNDHIEMPSQRDIEEKIKSEISNKIKAGIFILAKNLRSKRLVWKVFDLIQTTNGRFLENYACCSICKHLYKTSSLKTVSLYSHNCYTQFVRDGKMHVDKTTKEVECQIRAGICERNSKADRDKRKLEISSNIAAGTYKLLMKAKGKSVVWQIFAMITDSYDRLIEDYCYCTKCKQISSFDGRRTTNLARHPCVKKARLHNKASVTLNTDEDEEGNEYEMGRQSYSKEEIATFATLNNDSNAGCSLSRQIKVYNEDIPIHFREKSKENPVKAPVDDCYSICVKEEYSFRNSPNLRQFNLKENPFKKTLKTTENDEEYPNENEFERQSSDEEEINNFATLTDDSNADDSSLSQQIKLYNEDISTKFREKSKENPMKAEIDDCYSICVKEEYNFSNSLNSRQLHLKEHFVKETLETTENDKEYRNENEYEIGRQRSGKEEIATFANPTGDSNADESSLSRQINEYDNPITFQEKSKENTVKAENDDSYSICVKEEYSFSNSPNQSQFSLKENSFKETLVTTEYEEKYPNLMETEGNDIQKDFSASEGIIINEETETIEENENIAEEIEKNLKIGLYKLVMKPSKNNRDIWKKYRQISKDDGSIVKGYHCCIHCRKLFKIINDEFAALHQHLEVCSKPLPDSDQLTMTGSKREREKNEIKSKLISGVYKLTIQKYTHGELWKKYAVITKAEDGSLLEGYYCCIHCRKIFNTFNKLAPTLYRHIPLCPKELKADNDTGLENDTGSENLNTSKGIERNEGDSCHDLEEDKITTRTSDDEELLAVATRYSIPENPIWKKFTLIWTDEGRTELSCRLCKMILECNDKSKEGFKEHKCLKADNKNSLQIMPSQRDIEEQIKSEISKNIKTGTFKLTKKQGDKRLPWKVFDMVTTTNGCIVPDYTHCSICKKILRCYLMKIGSLRTHKCYTQFGRLTSEQMDDNNSKEEGNIENNEKVIENKIRCGIYKVKPGKVSTNPIWARFSLISKSDGMLIKEMVCCRLCIKVLKYQGQSSEVDLQQHKCLPVVKARSSNRKYSSKSYSSKSSELKTKMDKRKLEIKSNISSGVYKLFMNHDGKSVAWKLFARIIDADDTLIDDYVFCTKCKRISIYNGHRTGNLTRHPCVKNSSFRKEPSALNTETDNSSEDSESNNDEELEWETNNKRLPTIVNEAENECITKRPRIEEEQNVIFSNDRNLNRTFYGKMEICNKAGNIKNNHEYLMHASDPIWLRFELFSMENTSTSDRVIRCRQCKMILKYDATTKDQLEKHKCFPMALQNSNDRQLVDVPNQTKEKLITGTLKEESLDDSASFCVKEEFSYTEYNIPIYSSSKPMENDVKQEECQYITNELNDDDTNSKPTMEIKKEFN